MAEVTVVTAAYALAIEDASIVALEVDGSGHLIATKGSGDEVDVGAVTGDTPDSSTTVKGIVELATSVETLTGTDNVRATTPEGVKAVADTKQPLDSDLTAIAALAGTNDNVIQRKSGAWVERTPAQLGADLISAGPVTGIPADASATVKGIVELATPAEATTGTDTVRAVTPEGLKTVADTKQPLDSDLTAIATISAANDSILQRKSSAWVERTMAQLALDQNPAAAPQVLSDGATINTDASLGNHFRVTLGGNRTLAAPSNAVDGRRIMYEFIQDGTGSRTITLATGGSGQFLYGTDIPAIVLTTTASKRDFVGVIYSSALSRWLVVAFVKGF